MDIAGDIKGFDHRAENHRVGAGCLWSRMREVPELPESGNYGGFRIATRYADVAKIATKFDLFSSASGISFPDLDFGTRMYPAEADPPVQREYRRMLSRFLTRERVALMEPSVRQHVVTLLDKFPADGRVDFFAAFARPLPVLVSLELFGFPLADAAMLDGLVVALHDERGNEKAMEAAVALTRYLENLLLSRKAVATDPDADILSSIVLSTIDGVPMTLDEQVAMLRLLLFGGFATVAIVLSTALHWFALHPDDMNRLRDDPGLMDSAIEEFVRFASPATYLKRTVTQDTVLGCTHLRQGERVLISFAAANRDPAKFEAPDEVRLDRQENNHLGFGIGVHRCIGSLVAKLELRTALEEILERYERVEIDPAGTLKWESGENQGIIALPLILHRRPPAGQVNHV